MLVDIAAVLQFCFESIIVTKNGRGGGSGDKFENRSRDEALPGVEFGQHFAAFNIDDADPEGGVFQDGVFGQGIEVGLKSRLLR